MCRVTLNFLPTDIQLTSLWEYFRHITIKNINKKVNLLDINNCQMVDKDFCVGCCSQQQKTLLCFARTFSVIELYLGVNGASVSEEITMATAR